MKTIIVGTGRSGTTALYTLIQEILLKNRSETDFVYEPFLRDKTYFNARYDEAARNAQYMDSLSFEGIFNHLTIPLFVPDPEPYQNNSYLQRILNPQQPPNMLAKFIRANGRLLLLKRVCPDCKIIFIIRNPVDVVNSLMDKFSFYGGEFHKDDLTRFIDETNKLFGLAQRLEDFKTTAEKEFLFWYYMNRFALETLKQKEIAGAALAVCCENYNKEREFHVKKICDFLGLDFSPDFLETAKKRVGSITRTFTIPSDHLELYKKYLQEYYTLAADYGFEIGVKAEEILAKYKIVAEAPLISRPFYGLHTRAIIREYEAILKKHNVKK